MTQRGARQIGPHTHEGPRVDAVDDLYVMFCETCGVRFLEGTATMTDEERAAFNEVFAPELNRGN